jgi:hypothetical protein
MICAYCEKRILYWQKRYSVYKDGFELPGPRFHIECYEKYKKEDEEKNKDRK